MTDLQSAALPYTEVVIDGFEPSAFRLLDECTDLIVLYDLVTNMGLEPMTFRLLGEHSNQVS